MRLCRSILVSILICACSEAPQRPSFSQDELAASIREVGFKCGEPAGATEIARDWWRIRCTDAEVYVAYAGSDGGICFEPVTVGDTDIPTAVVAPQPRCTGELTVFTSRIGEVPQEILKGYADRGQLVPTNHDLTVDERQKLAAAFEALTPLHEAILREHLRSISFAEGLPANAQTVRVTPNGAKPVFDLIINAEILNETVSEFATRRERQLFSAANSPLTVSVVAGSMDAVAFVVAHEGTHVVDMVLGLTPSPTPPGFQIPEGDQKPFARGIWENSFTFASQFRGGLLESSPVRTGGQPLDIEQARALYEDLERTPFVSVYASSMVIEDLAELVAWRQMTGQHGQPYRIEIRSDGKLIYSYEPMESLLVSSRLDQLQRFDSPQK